MTTWASVARNSTSWAETQNNDYILPDYFLADYVEGDFTNWTEGTRPSTTWI